MFYTTTETFVEILRNKERLPRASSYYEYMRESDVIVIDDVFYSDLTREELHLFYRGISFLNESRSLIIITSRDVSAWYDASEDKHLLQTITDRLTSGSQLIRLN